MARNGKIAKLPLAVREELNRRLLDGQTASKILPWLNGLAEVKACCEEDFEGILINDGNLSEWRKGGYAEWLRKRDKVERTRELAKYSVELAKASGGNLAEGAAAVLSGQILDLLEGVDDLGAGLPAQGGESNGEGPSPLQAAAESLNALTLSVARLRKGDHNAQAIRQNDERLEQSKEALELEKQKFMRTTCELFLKWAEDHRAKDIASSPVPNTAKIEQLGELMFGEDWGTPEKKR